MPATPETVGVQFGFAGALRRSEPVGLNTELIQVRTVHPKHQPGICAELSCTPRERGNEPGGDVRGACRQRGRQADVRIFPD